ncbi:hypothetical protein [Motilimonas sp. KMU-193]|uniref:hypothetical protein n=1 Tax=Motilimonas sp. KMU-193 TaxID=3388668 RepID=UPI00396B3068
MHKSVHQSFALIAAAVMVASVQAKQVTVPFSGAFPNGEPVQGVLSYDDAAPKQFANEYSGNFIDSSPQSYVEVTLAGQTYRVNASANLPFNLDLHWGMGDGRRDLVILPNQRLYSANGTSIQAMDIIISDADGAQQGQDLPSVISLNPVTGPNRHQPGYDWAELYFPDRQTNNFAELSQVGSEQQNSKDKVSYGFEAIVEFANQPPLSEQQIASGTITWETQLPKVYGSDTDAEYEDHTPEITFKVGQYSYQIDPSLDYDMLKVGVHRNQQGLLLGYHFYYGYPLQGTDQFGNPAPELQDFVLDVYLPNPALAADLSVPTSLPSLQTPDIHVRIHTMAGGLKVVNLVDQSDFISPVTKVLINADLNSPETNLIVPAKGGKISFFRDVWFVEPPSYPMPTEPFYIRYGENITWPNGFVYSNTGTRRLNLYQEGIGGLASFYVPKHWPAGEYSFNLYAYEDDTGAVATKTVKFTKLK